MSIDRLTIGTVAEAPFEDLIAVRAAAAGHGRSGGAVKQETTRQALRG